MLGRPGVKDVAAAVIVRDGHVLMGRRAPGQNLAGYWEFPGGKLEPGETVQQCVERELAEELSVECVAGAVMMAHLHRYDGGAINLIAVRVHLIGDAWRLSVHDAVEWIGPAGLADLKLAPADIAIVEAVRRELLAAAIPSWMVEKF
jgi:8-oxo-dGTP diphosphatase